DLALADASFASNETTLYIVGGRTSDGLSKAIFSVTLDDGGEIKQTELTELPVALKGLSATVNGSTLYVAGATNDGNEKKILSLDLKDSSSGEWEEMTVWPGEGQGATLMAYQQGSLFLTQTIVSKEGVAGTVLYRLKDGETEWSSCSAPPAVLGVGAALSIRQSFIIFGAAGIDQEGVELFTYNTITDEWVSVGKAALDQDLRAIMPWYVKKSPPETDVTGVVVVQGSGEGATVVLIELVVAKGMFAWVDYTVVIIYLGSMILIGLYFSKREKGTEDFFVGGRKMPWWAVGFSLYATGTSAISFMALPAISFRENLVFLSGPLFGLVGIVVVAFYMVPMIRRLNVTTTYEYLEARFHPSVRVLCSIISIAFQVGGRMSVVLYLPALALSAVTGIDVISSIIVMGIIATVYTVLGGIKAVIWTDVVQVVVLLGGAFLCLVIILSHIDGGIAGAWNIAVASDKVKMFDWRWEFAAPTAWVFLLLAIVDITAIPRDQVMMQRILSTKSDKAAGRSVIMMALIVIPGSLLFFGLGTALFVFYKSNPAELSPLLINNDSMVPFFIASQLPVGITGLIIAALFAASMSTLDSSMNSVATLVTVDFYKRFKKGVTDESCLRLAKWITVLVGVIGTGIALYMSRFDLMSLYVTFMGLMGLIGGGVGGVYMLGMFSRRANWQGVWIGAIFSLVLTLVIRQSTDVHALMYLPISVVSCLIVGYITSFAFPAPQGSLKGLTVFKEN
ncbi:MAG: sodium/solute symporter, partial [Opitutaceae bacterium]|nr:sodium/solute symporter [Opitutaceae bacterium]